MSDSQPACWVAYNSGSSAVPGCIHVDSGGSLIVDSWDGFVKLQTNHITVAQVTSTDFDLLALGSSASTNSASLLLNSINNVSATQTGQIQAVASGGNQNIVINTVQGSILLKSSGVSLLTVTPSPAANATSMGLLVNNNGGVNLVSVLLGAADSCGTGFRCMKIAN